jgi:hypothetical protein
MCRRSFDHVGPPHDLRQEWETLCYRRSYLHAAGQANVAPTDHGDACIMLGAPLTLVLVAETLGHCSTPLCAPRDARCALTSLPAARCPCFTSPIPRRARPLSICPTACPMQRPHVRVPTWALLISNGRERRPNTYGYPAQSGPPLQRPRPPLTNGSLQSPVHSPARRRRLASQSPH